MVSNGALVSTEPLGDGHARFTFAQTKPISTYLTALIAGDYHRADRVLHTPSGDLPAAVYCRESLADHLDADRIFDVTERRLRRLRAGIRPAVPVRQVRPGLRPGVQRRRDGERRLRDPARRVRLPEPSDPRLLPGPRRHDPARAVPHVVRRPGDHALVGRPLAEGVVRHLGVQLRPQPDRRGSRVRLGVVHQRVQDLGLPPGPAPLHPPDRRRHGRSGGRRAELRRHHLLQGRLGARPAGGVRRAGGVPGRLPAVLPTARVRQHRPDRPAGRAARRLRSRSVGLVGAVAGDDRGEHAAARDDRRGRHDHVVRRPSRAPHRSTRRCARTASPSVCTPSGTVVWSGSAGSRPTSPASGPTSPSWWV